MKSAVNWLTSNRNLAIFVIAMQGVAYYFVATRLQFTWLWLVVALDAAVIAGLACRQRWAVVLGTALVAWSAVMSTMSIFTKGWKVSRAAMAVGTATIAWGLARSPYAGFFDDEVEAPAADNKADDKPLISLVHLRRFPRYLEPVVLAQALSDAWGLNITGNDDEEEVNNADGFVVGREMLYFVMITKPQAMQFIVHNFEGKYFNSADELASKVPNLRFAEIIREHEAWLTVDLLGSGATDTNPDVAYRMIGKAISALADGNTLALLCPQHNYFNIWDDALQEILCGNDPLSVFREEVKAPVIGVPKSESLDHAIAEARRRWPEFSDAFKNRKDPEEPFLVKAAFKHEDDTEHMWLTVYGLEPEYVHGHLVNEPFHNPQLKNGMLVEVPVSDVSDWVCMLPDGSPLGNFTGEAVNKARHPGEQPA